MPERVTEKAQLLQMIDEERVSWDRLLATVGEDRMNRPGVAGEWTFRDVIAHLNGWREWTVARLDAVRSGSPPSPPWPAEYDEESDADVDPINAWLHERDSGKSGQDVIAESRGLFDRLRSLVEEIPLDDLMTPGRFAWYGEYAAVDSVRGTFGHLYEEHMPAIEAWMAETR